MSAGICWGGGVVVPNYCTFIPGMVLTFMHALAHLILTRTQCLFCYDRVIGVHNRGPSKIHAGPALPWVLLT